MALPGSVKKHPFLSTISVLLLIGGLGLTAVFYNQATFVDDQGCGWTAFNNSNGGNFTSIDQVENYFDEHGQEIPENLSLRVENDTVYQQVPGSCGTVGGETA